MNSEKLRYYGDLLMKYREYVIFVKVRKDMDLDIRKLQDEVNALADRDPEFKHLLVDVMLEYRVQSCNKGVCLDTLYEFSEGKPVEFDDISLVWISDLYRYNLDFRKWCDGDEALRQALTYWLDEYHRRAADDESFAALILLRKLRWFYLGELGLEIPVEFDETERELLVRLYHTDSKFRKMLDEENVIVREAVASWLEEQYQGELEEKKP